MEPENTKLIGNQAEPIAEKDGVLADDVQLGSDELKDGVFADAPIEPVDLGLNVLEREPVLSAITGLIVAALALLAAFGVDFTTAQVGAITGFVVTAYGVGARFIRKRVTPTANPQLAADLPLVPDPDA